MIFIYFTKTWHIRIVHNAASWLSGVTPAQQDESTQTGSSGAYALTRSALDTTQISVQRPIISTPSYSPSRMYPARSMLPNEPLSKIRRPFAYSCISGISSHPQVPFLQCSTGRRRPSCVPEYASVCVSLVNTIS